MKHRSRRAAKRAAFLIVLTVIILALLLMSVTIFAARCMSGAISGDSDTKTESAAAPPSETSDTSALTEPETTAPPETTALSAAYELKTMDLDDLHSGYQILVNYQNAFVFDSSDFKIKTFYGNKNRSYKISGTNVSFDSLALNSFNDMMAAFETETGSHDILVNSTLRTFEEQEEIYAYRVEQYGTEYAAMFVAVPGFSEHHTGIAADLTVYTDKNESMTLDKFPEYIEWLGANAHKYGFILRYPADKTDITKIGYENWHYRYIGKPHAYYMHINNLCLEEYIEELRKHPYNGNHLKITDDEGQPWEIYFVKAIDEKTDVPVPIYDEYTVSGNNVDGFIITIKG